MKLFKFGSSKFLAKFGPKMNFDIITDERHYKPDSTKNLNSKLRIK